MIIFFLSDTKFNEIDPHHPLIVYHLLAFFINGIIFFQFSVSPALRFSNLPTNEYVNFCIHLMEIKLYG